MSIFLPVLQDTLNPQQKLAVNHIEGPMLIIAGAGSGKTRVVTHRIAKLLQVGVPASEIVAVTFTNKAAEEMSHRVSSTCHARVLAATFHSLSAHILRESISHLGYSSQFVIYDEDDSEKLLKRCLKDLGLKEDKGLLKSAKEAISNAKNHLIGPDDFPKDQAQTAEGYRLYQTRLKEADAVDFDDLLFLAVQLLKNYPDVLAHYQQRWVFFLIDEYQDTNYAQAVLIQLLAGPRRNVFAVGDPDQSIYSWRGANIGNILKFHQDYPGAEVVTLDQNYRSHNQILKAANGLIAHNQGRHAKNLWSSLGEGEKIGLYICENERDEAQFVLKRLINHHRAQSIPYQDCVIFYRTNFQSRLFEDALLRAKIPYQIIGGLSFYQRREVKDILAFLRMLVSNTDIIAFTRTINLPKRGIGESTVEKIGLLSQQNNSDLLSTLDSLLRGVSELRLTEKQKQGIDQYLQLILALRARREMPVEQLIQEVIDRTLYLSVLKEDPETEEEKRANLEELIAKAHETKLPLVNFLEELSLLSSTDRLRGSEDCVKLMTLHNGKGLEFSVVFLVGMEEDLLPHIHSKEDGSAVEEERRLCYVGMTRAKKVLYLTATRSRFLWGTERRMRPSRFLFEIPQEHLQAYQAELLPPTPAHPLAEGDTVSHRDFGRGIIQKVYNTSLGETYDVYFHETRTSRSLVAKYAKLTRL